MATHSSIDDEASWNDLKLLAKEQHQTISELLNVVIREIVQRKRVRPAVPAHLETSMEQNEELAKSLAQRFNSSSINAGLKSLSVHLDIRIDLFRHAPMD